jgi:hypothetical protein
VWVATRWRRKRGEKASALTYLWPPEVGSWVASTDFREARHGCTPPICAAKKEEGSNDPGPPAVTGNSMPTDVWTLSGMAH